MEVEIPTPVVDVTRVRITDIDIPIGSLIILMFKVCIAAIPVAILVSVASVVIAALLAGITGVR